MAIRPSAAPGGRADASRAALDGSAGVGALRVVEVTGAGSPGFDGLLALRRAHDAEIWTGDPPVPAQELAAELFAPPPDRRMWSWLATLDGEPVAAAHGRGYLDGANDGTVRYEVTTLPAHRRRGIARRVASVGLPVLAAAGATSLFAWPLDAGAEAFCRYLGMTRRQEDEQNRLRIADLDADQQRQWIDQAPARAAGYRLVGWVGPCPEEWVELVARALDAMADAPTDDFDWAVAPLTVAQVRDGERSSDAQGYDLVRTLALAPDGTAAGMSELMVSRLRPSLARQGDTGVIAAHRGHALGRWLKAANLRRALAHEPGIEVVETFSASSNGHMTAINRAMGFRSLRTFATYQGAMADALAATAGA
jgi:GNAT superfamily N-acetyltransferase